jgi:hypothetical protein
VRLLKTSIALPYNPSFCITILPYNFKKSKYNYLRIFLQKYRDILREIYQVEVIGNVLAVRSGNAVIGANPEHNDTRLCSLVYDIWAMDRVMSLLYDDKLKTGSNYLRI